MNHTRTIRSIERENNGLVCIACGTLYPDAATKSRSPECPAEKPHYRYSVDWIRAYQAGGEWRSLLPAGYEDTFRKHHDVLMGVKLPPPKTR